MPSQLVRQSQGRRALILGAVLPAALVAGLTVRLYRLDSRTLTHPEFWVPRIEVPDYVRHPAERMDATTVLKQTIENDKHPPGYHLLMLAWNTLFGTGIIAMRLSSVLFGMLALGALYVYARKEAGIGIAWLGTWLLALHGYHVFWSQQLRPWVLLSFLAVLSSLLLIQIQDRWRLAAGASYALVAGFGLWVDYYFWPIFAAQVLWVLLRNAGRRPVPPALWAQTLAFLLATPVVIFIREQLGRASHLPSDLWPFILQMLQFGGILNVGNLSGRLPDLAPWISAVVGFAGAIALAAGVRARAQESPDAADAQHSSDGERPSAKPLLAVGLLLVVGLELVFAPLIGHRLLFFVAALAPWSVVAVWLVAVRAWPLVSRALYVISDVPIIRHVSHDLTAMLAFGVFLMLMLVHVAKPILAPYALVSLTPFYLVLAARGVHAARLARPVMTGALIGLFLFSVYQWGNVRTSNRDYKQLAERLIPHIQEGDVVLVEEQWWTSPIHYYLNPGAYRVIPPPGPDATSSSKAADAELPDRIWIIDFGPDGLLEERIRGIATRLPYFEERMRISAYNAGAALYERRTTSN